MELFIGVRALLRPAVPIDSFRNSTPFLVCWRSGEETCDFFEEFHGFRASFSSNYSLAVVGFQWRLPTDCNCFLPCGYRGVSGSVLETLLERVPSVFLHQFIAYSEDYGYYGSWNVFSSGTFNERPQIANRRPTVPSWARPRRRPRRRPNRRRSIRKGKSTTIDHRLSLPID